MKTKPFMLMVVHLRVEETRRRRNGLEWLRAGLPLLIALARMAWKYRHVFLK